IIKEIAIAVVVLLGALLIYAATQPDTFRIQRAATIKAPPERIFAVLNDFLRWESWSPWEKKDPAMKRTFSAVTSGKGAVYVWEGNRDVGQGRMEIAQTAGKVWRDHGALEYVESVGDDVKPGKHTSFPQSVKLKSGETVVFAYVVYKSRAHRDRVNAKVMKDKRLAKMMDPKTMPFDGKRMFWGGFKVLVDA